ncbi:MAG TPA: hypothetical protein VIF62_35490 [Labilithrix sp.]|jgi:hypothetical protein
MERMERVTATFDRSTLKQVRRRAGRRGVSAFIQAAVREKLEREAVLAVLDALDSEHGAPSAELLAEIDVEARAALKKTKARR